MRSAIARQAQTEKVFPLKLYSRLMMSATLSCPHSQRTSAFKRREAKPIASSRGQYAEQLKKQIFVILMDVGINCDYPQPPITSFMLGQFV